MTPHRAEHEREEEGEPHDHAIRTGRVEALRRAFARADEMERSPSRTPGGRVRFVTTAGSSRQAAHACAPQTCGQG